MAQQGFYIPKQGKVYFAGDTATIFSNVINYGNLGVGKKATVDFKGYSWQNDPLSLITDESSGTTGVGGWIRFIGDTLRQQIYGGYNAAAKAGPAFPHLLVQNKNGIGLLESSTKVKGEVAFAKGHIYLNDKIFVVGNNNPGTISGYTQDSYFITGTKSNGGILLRENIREGDGLVVFPVGTKAGAYTPAAIQSHTSKGDNYYVTLFDGAKSGVITGNDLATVGVNKTWQTGKMLYPGEGEVEVYLQHLNADEGSKFTPNRKNAYVAQYVGSGWDTSAVQGTPVAGYLTTGAALGNSGVNNRTLYTSLSNASYFTKFTGNGSTIGKTKLLLGAYRVYSTRIDVRWQTKPEVNVKYYIVQRCLSNERNFKNVSTAIPSLAPNGVSFNYLNYNKIDSNTYKGISFYRLQVFDYNNNYYYSDTVAINGAGFNQIKLWPNPTPDQFYIVVNSPQAKAVVITNVLGQQLWSREVNRSAQTFIEVKGLGLRPGVYFVSIIDQNGDIADTEKLVIIRE